MTFEIEAGGRMHVVSVEPLAGAGPSGGRFRLRVRDASAGGGAVETIDIDARATDLGLSIRYVGDGRVVDAAVTPGEAGVDLVQLPHAGVDVQVDARRVRRDDQAAAGGAGEQRLTAPMPGRVLRVLVQPGEAVSAGQGLVVVEAMKMENELSARRDGHVREIAVAEGQSVEAGRLLLVIA